jgi:hypothetical protein
MRPHFLHEQQTIVPQHRANRTDDEHQVHLTHPPVHLTADFVVTPPAAFEIHMNRAQRKPFRGAGMTFAARVHEVALVNRGERILGR